MSSTPLPRNPERWNDARPKVTAAAHGAMTDGACGPALEIFMASFTHDEQLAMAHAISNVVISAYIADLAQRGQ